MIEIMIEKIFKLTGEYIELIRLLKVMHIVESGGQAKMIVEQKEVRVNGTTEIRKRAKLRSGDRVSVFDQEILIQ